MPGERPIGVFDSGVGGLTVLRALAERLPREQFLYLGDTARLPYGTKSPHTVARYAVQAAHLLVDRGIKMLVVACNTASAVAVEVLREEFPELEVVGVVEPGAEAACRESRSGHIAVIGTEGTISGGAYTRAIIGQRTDAQVLGRACSLFVALAEEGWLEGPIPDAVAHTYLSDLPPHIDTLVLGCTHFPLLLSSIAKAVGPEVTIVDSAATTAAYVERILVRRNWCRVGDPGTQLRFLATDGGDRFVRVGSRFLGTSLGPEAIEVVDL